MKPWTDERCSWLALCSIPGLGNTVVRKLLERFGGPEAVFAASPEDLMAVKGVRLETARRIADREFSSDPAVELSRVEACGARVIAYEDPAYPALLRQLDSPPMLLYARGRDIPQGRACAAVVGSRNPTHYGLRAAERIAAGLAERDIVVVSGLARGIDSAAHWGCLEKGGGTIAVLGTGIDRIYPASNKKLWEQIAEKGSILSEFPTGTPPEPRNFPIRNRIISGLSRGVVVVEATKRSGSLITASFALDQGRDVFAVPGSIDSFKSTGCHWLIKQGAKLVENAEDILEEWEGSAPPGESEGHGEGSPEPAAQLDPSEKAVFELIGDYPVHIDELLRGLDLSPGETLSALMRMELKGIIKQLPGKRFVR